MQHHPGARHRRAISWALITILLGPIVFAPAGFALESSRQTGQAVSSLQTVIVSEFDNRDRNRAGGSELARWASDAIAVEMASSARFEVLKRQEVSRAAGELGYRAPYDQAQLVKIATNLGASGVVMGEIAAVKLDEGKGVTKAVRVGVRV